MKKILVSILIAILSVPFVWAVPADPTPYKYTQPDGTVIVLQNHGDEFYHWTTDYSSGQVVKKGADGFYRPASLDLEAMAQAEELRADNYARWSSYDNPKVTNFGDRKVLCIIANFSDSTFVVPDPNTHFKNMLNQPGYDYNGAIGSVRDYFVDNSRNQYRPQFDVFGPVTLSQSSKYYDDNGAHTAIFEAYDLLIASGAPLNIADYDTDNNGEIDMILFYYPGHNEAEGAGEESIWPHQSTGYFGEINGKVFNRYFCTSELRGYDGTEPAAIGTTCHEFSHSLGIPDFYDTDKATNGNNPSADLTYNYDLMCYGNYNDRGRRPPYLNAVERNMLGWMDYPTPITASGSLTLPAIQNNTAYQFATANTGEYYILESRNGEKWDSYLSAGLLIYHVDKSERAILGSTTPAYLWENTNQINAIGGHPCIYLKKSSGYQYVFPGSGDVTSFIPHDWNGDDLGLSLTDIAFDGTQSSFTVTVTSQRTVFGVVKDSSGNPISGAEVSLTPSTGAFDAAPALLPTSIVCTTDAQGNYSLSLENSASEYQILVARKDGYVASCVNMTISSLFTEQDLLLLQQGEGDPADLCKYDNSKTLYKAGLGDGDIAIGMRYTAAELMAAGALGAKLSTVTFVSAAPTESTVYIVVNIGDEKTLRRDVSSQYTQGSWITVDVSDANITIPSGKDVFIGYGIKDVPDNSSNYYFYGYGFETSDFGEGYYCYDFLNNASSYPVEFGTSQYLGFTVSAELSRISEITFSTLGVSYIKLNGNTPEVAVAAGKSLKSTAWYLDGEAYAYNALPAKDTVATGTHVYKVVLTYYDGTKETVFYEFDKQ